MTIRRYRRLRVTGLLAAAIASALALGACASNTNSAPQAGSPGYGDSAGDAGKDPAVGEPGTDGGVAGAPRPAATGGTDVPAQERALIYTGSLTVTTNNVVKTADDAIALATAVGGIVAADRRDLDSDRSSATIVFRVPSAKFATTVDALAKLGTEESRAVQTDDVTEAIVDLDARLATQQASVDRVRALLARAQSISEITALESELSRREADLDSLKQRREKLAGLVSLSTITLYLRGPAAPLTQQQEDETGFVAGLKGGWKAFLASVTIVMTVLGFLLPWLLSIGVPVWLLVWGVRRGRRRRRPAVAAAPSSATTAAAFPASAAPTTMPAGASTAPAPRSAPPSGPLPPAPPVA